MRDAITQRKEKTKTKFTVWSSRPRGHRLGHGYNYKNKSISTAHIEAL